MPLDIVILAPMAANILLQREVAEALSPPLVAAEIRGGGAVEFAEFDGTPVLTLGRAKRVDHAGDIDRVLGTGSTPTGVTVSVEGVIPFGQFQRGLLLANSLAILTEGVLITRGLS